MATESTTTATTTTTHQHGVEGVYYGGSWVDMEDLAGTFVPNETSKCSTCENANVCPRSRSRVVQGKPVTTTSSTTTTKDDKPVLQYDVIIIGAGCIGAAIARELSKYAKQQNTTADGLSILWLEAADDVSQGATKGNSGIVHAGYDDKPGTNRAKYCWPGNQMFAQLDKELRFGYQKNGSLVLAMNEVEKQHLYELLERGKINGVQNLRVIDSVEELRQMEPAVNPQAIAALYAPDAGNVIPYEYAIALAENAVDNGVELRIRRCVQDIKILSSSSADDGNFQVTADYWEPTEYVQSQASAAGGDRRLLVHAIASMTTIVLLVILHTLSHQYFETNPVIQHSILGLAVLCFVISVVVAAWLMYQQTQAATATRVPRDTPLAALVEQAGEPAGRMESTSSETPSLAVRLADMLMGGSGSPRIQQGHTVATETYVCRYVINCAGGAADQVAALIGDTSFHIHPRVGDYILLNRNQGHLAKHTLFPCPDPKLGKGVLVQTTLWGNLILGPTARDMHDPAARDLSPAQIQEYILSKCRQLVPSFDPAETIHAFAGARAKSDRGDWILEPSPKHPHMIHVAGIDSPGLAGSPAIALQVVNMLQQAGLIMKPNPQFRPERAPIITPKPKGWKGLKVGPVGKFDSIDGTDTAVMAANVICKCEKVTELEVVRALRRSLPIDSSQGIRKRTRAGMGHCQGDPNNYNCEARVRAIIAREQGVPVAQVGGRPWPATSTLPERWLTDEEKQELVERASCT